jgi:hypothetical protein
MPPQIVLCLGEKCTGVSVVWSAVVGSIATVFAAVRCCSVRVPVSPPPSTAPVVVAVVCGAASLYSLALWVFYAATAPPITTVAHAAAVALGVLWSSGRQVLLVRLRRTAPTAAEQLLSSDRDRERDVTATPQSVPREKKSS